MFAAGALAWTAPVAAHEGDDEEPPAEVPTTSPDVSAVAPHGDGHGLESSWPRDGAELWVPPKEGRLGFSEPVKSSTLVLTLARTDGAALADDEVVRLTSGEAVSEILLRLPPLRPGGYSLEWAVVSASGANLSGRIGFGLEPPIAAVGGQNHRHGESHLYEDTPGQFALRLLFVFAVAFLFAAVRRVSARSQVSVLDRAAVRTGAALLALAVVVGAIVDAVAWIGEYHDTPLSALVAAPGLSLLLPVLVFCGYLMVTARVSSAVLWAGVGVFASYAGLSHAIRTALGVELFVVFTVLLTSLALLWADLLRGVVGLVHGGDAGFPFARLARSTVVLVVASVTMLLLHAGTFDLHMAFARDLRSRLVLAAVLTAAIAPLSFLASRRGALRVLCLAPVLVVFVVSAALVWMPPPAAGL